jgi:hypothetical protein
MPRAAKKAKTTTTPPSASTPRSLSPVPPVAGARSPNYTVDEDIWLCRAFVKGSLNAKAGVGMRRDTFWSLIKKDFDAIQASELNNGSSRGGDETDDDSVIELKKQDSLYQRFGRKIAPEVKRFLVVRSAHKENSGENEEAYHARLLVLHEMKYSLPFKFLHCVPYLEDLPNFSRNKDPTMVEGMDLEVGSAVQTIACDLERPVGAKKSSKLATIERQTAGRVAKMEYSMKKHAAEATDRVNNVVAAIANSNSLMKQKTMINLWIAQRSYYMGIGNTGMASIYDDKLKHLDDPEEEQEPSIPGSIPGTPTTPTTPATTATSPSSGTT